MLEVTLCLHLSPRGPLTAKSGEQGKHQVWSALLFADSAKLLTKCGLPTILPSLIQVRIKILLDVYLLIWLHCILVIPLSHQESSEQGLLSSCGARASHCCGFSCCRAWAVGHVGSRSCSSWALEHKLSSCSSVAPLHVGSSQIKYRTCVS